MNWVREFGKYSAVKQLRPRIQDFDRPGRIITGRFFRLPGRRLLQVHRFKLANIATSHKALSKYLDRLLQGDLKINHRTFALNLKLTLDMPAPAGHESYACAVARLAAKAADTAGRSLAALQKFMLATDKATVATGVPVFLSSGESRTVLHRNGGWLGQIGFLQAFGGIVTILEYQPEAEEGGGAEFLWFP